MPLHRQCLDNVRVAQSVEAALSNGARSRFESVHGHQAIIHLLRLLPGEPIHQRALSSAVERLFYMQDVGRSIRSARTNWRP
jgi:hypothetical protein